MRGIYYETVANYLKNFLNKKKNLNILEIGCGKKQYKNLTKGNIYHGLDLPSSQWVNKKNKPEILEKLSSFKAIINYDFIFSIGTIFLLDDKDLKTLIKLINILKDRKGKIIIFDYKIKTIYKLEYKQNHYEKILKQKFKNNFKKINYDWCNTSLINKKIKEILNINPSHIIEIDFT
jgi:predicted RNase H-related nuclease YkuK (DUF458 family)